ncbi:MAG: C45 family autoproteolytic acyltransferase/hydrolase [Planctomycetota bacterium]
MNRQAKTSALFYLMTVAVLVGLAPHAGCEPERGQEREEMPARGPAGAETDAADTKTPAPDPKPDPPAREPRGRLERIQGYLVLHVAGSPEQMGEQHGRLLRPQIRKARTALITDGYSGGRYERLIEGTKVMEKHQPPADRRELRALAEAAGIDHWDCVAMQLFGDVDRGQPWPWGADEAGVECTSFAAFGKATKTGELIAGRNMDYWDAGVTEYGAVLMHARPDDGYAFVTVTWAGIINGWTLMNEKGLVTANNSAYGGTNSLEGISTCFMLRKVAQHASGLEEAIALVRKGPRACGTSMLIADGDPPGAVVVEFDHRQVAVRRAKQGYVIADNSFRRLGGSGGFDDVWFFSRYAKLKKLITRHYGKIDRTMNFAGAEGVPMSSNLHSVMLFPKDLILRVAMGKTPAYKQPYRGFRMIEAGLVAEKEAPPEP